MPAHEPAALAVPRGARVESQEEVLSDGPETTRALGSALAERLAEGDVLLLFGELGTGKTCLVQGLASGLGVEPRRVHSPSFIMVNRYQGRERALNHVDLYRLEAGEDFSDLGLDDLFGGPDLTAVEWAERLPEAARPLPRWEIHLRHRGEMSRRIVLRRLEPARADPL